MKSPPDKEIMEKVYLKGDDKMNKDINFRCPICGAGTVKVPTEQGITISVCTQNPDHIRKFETPMADFLKIPQRAPYTGPETDFNR